MQPGEWKLGAGWDIFKQTCFFIRYNKEIYEPVCEKTNNLGSDQVQHKPVCTVTEDGWRLEILDLESRGIVLSV